MGMDIISIKVYNRHMTDREKVKLSFQQGNTYSFIADYIAKNKRSPSYREIGKHLGVSDVRVQQIVHKIKERGWIYFARGQAERKIRIKKI